MKYVFAALSLATTMFYVASAQSQQMVKMCLFYGSPSGHTRSDPIIDQTCSSGHVHTFYGPQDFHPSVTYEELRDTKPEFSSTPFVENESLYWHPSIYEVVESNGVKTYTRVSNLETSPYYRWDKSVLPAVEAFPSRFRMIAASNDGGADQGGENGSNMFTECCDLLGGENEQCESWDRLEFPNRNCDFLGIAFAMPTCWNGDLGIENDHKNHMAYTLDGNVNGPCPANYNRRVPQIQLFVRINNYRGASRNYELSDGQSEFHVDFFNGWQEGKLEQIIQDCEYNPDQEDGDYNPPCDCTQFLTPNPNPSGAVCDSDVRNLILDEEIETVIGSLPRDACQGPALKDKFWSELSSDLFNCTTSPPPPADDDDSDEDDEDSEDGDEDDEEESEEDEGDEDEDGDEEEESEEDEGDEDEDDGSEEDGSGDEEESEEEDEESEEDEGDEDEDEGSEENEDDEEEESEEEDDSGEDEDGDEEESEEDEDDEDDADGTFLRTSASDEEEDEGSEEDEQEDEEESEEEDAEGDEEEESEEGEEDDEEEESEEEESEEDDGSGEDEEGDEEEESEEDNDEGESEEGEEDDEEEESEDDDESNEDDDEGDESEDDENGTFPRTSAGDTLHNLYGKIYIIGDSLLDGTGSTEGEVETTLASRLSTVVVNNAVGGFTIPDISAVPSCSQDPSCAWTIIAGGINGDRESARDWMTTLVTREVNNGKKVIIQGYAPDCGGYASGETFTSMLNAYVDIAANTNNVWMVDARSIPSHPLMAEPCNPASREYRADDNSHPSPLSGRVFAIEAAEIILANGRRQLRGNAGNYS